MLFERRGDFFEYQSTTIMEGIFWRKLSYATCNFPSTNCTSKVVSVDLYSVCLAPGGKTDFLGPAFLVGKLSSVSQRRRIDKSRERSVHARRQALTYKTKMRSFYLKGDEAQCIEDHAP